MRGFDRLRPLPRFDAQQRTRIIRRQVSLPERFRALWGRGLVLLEDQLERKHGEEERDYVMRKRA